MRSKIFYTILIFLTAGSLLAQDFQTEITFTPSHDPAQAKTRTFGGQSTSADGYDANDVLCPPPGQLYYVYFSINEFPRYLWTDSREWISPYNSDITWIIVITNAENITTTLSWDPNSLPSIAGRHFYLFGTDTGTIEMSQTTSATVTGNARLEIVYTAVTAIFNLEMKVAPEGSGTTVPPVGVYTYDEGNVISISAINNAGFLFDHWTGMVEDSNKPNTTVTMDTDKIIIANFTYEEYTVSLSIIGNGSIILNPDQATYHLNDTVRVTAIPDTGWSFKNWSGDHAGDANPDTIIVTGNMNIVAEFEQDEYTLIVTNIGNGIVTKEPDQPSYHYGDSVEVTAYADIGWTFSHWSGDMAGNNNPEKIYVKGNTNINAHFVQNEYVLTVNIIGNGQVEKNPDQTTYHLNDVVQLTAQPDSGWLFNYWSGDVTSNENPVNVTMTGSMSVTSHFSQQEQPTFPDIELAELLYDFGEVEVGASASHPIWVNNIGTSILEVTRTTISGTNLEEFSVESGGAPFSLSPSDSHEVIIAFFPSSPVAKNARLKIVSNDPDEEEVYISLTGIGKAPLDTTETTYAFPNPFNPEMEHVNIVVEKSLEDITVKIVDPAGDFVRELEAPITNAYNSVQKIIWDGRDYRGDYAANGTYFYKLMRKKGKRLIGRITVLREFRRD